MASKHFQTPEIAFRDRKDDTEDVDSGQLETPAGRSATKNAQERLMLRGEIIAMSLQTTAADPRACAPDKILAG
jgi:hypothetical protein